MEFPIIQTISLILTISALIPIYILLKLYFKTRHLEYLLFGLFILDGTVILISEAIFITNYIVFVFIIHNLAIDSAYFLLLIHAFKYSWEKTPRLIWITGLLWYLSLILLGYLMDNNVLYRRIGDSYRIFVLLILIYVYIKVKPVFKSSNIDKAKILWILAWISLLIHNINLLNLQFFQYTDLNRILLVIGVIIAIYISIFLPEGILLSNSQITRALQAYDQLMFKNEFKAQPPIETGLIKDYMDEIKKIKAEKGKM